MRNAILVTLAAMTMLVPLGAASQPQIRIPGKVLRPITAPPRIAPGPVPRPLSNPELTQAFLSLTETTTPPTPQTKIKFSAMHMAGPGYAQFRNADVIGANAQLPPDGMVVLNSGRKAEAWFYLPNATKPYLMDCTMTFGFVVGAPLRLDFAVSAPDSALVSNGHVLFVVPPMAGPDGFTPVKVWSSSDATWFLYGCEATLMG